LVRQEEFLEEMRAIRRNRKLDSVLLMITDVLMDGTQLLFVGDEETIRKAFDIRSEDSTCAFLPKILSRKKQIIPMLSALWG
jgi:manganese-dependent inorganic pyrophosphatase